MIAVPRIVRFVRAAALTVMMLAISGLAAAQTSDSWVAGTVAEWNRVLAAAETYLDEQQYTQAQTRDTAALLDRARVTAESLRTLSQQDVERLQDLRASLGPPPAEGEPAEAESITEVRRQYAERLSAARARISEANLALTRINQISARLAALSRESLERELTKGWPIPVLPEVLAKGATDFVAVVRYIIGVPETWYQSLTADERTRLHRNLWSTAALAPIFAVAWFLRGLLLRRFGPRPDVGTVISYSRRLLAAITVALARGLIPAALIAGVLAWINRSGSTASGEFLLVLNHLLTVSLIFCLAFALPRAVFAPELPKWRLANVTPASARMIYQRFLVLAGIFAVDLFLVGTAGELQQMGAVEISIELEAVYFTVVTILEMAVLLSLMPDRLWQTETETTDSDDAAAKAPRRRRRGLWWFLRRLISVVAIAAMISGLAGYAGVGFFVAERLLFSGFVVGGVYLLRGLVRDVIDLLSRSPIVRRRLALSESGSQTAAYWGTIIVDLMLYIVGGLLIAPLWAISWDELSHWLLQVLHGFKIGDVTISPIAIVLSAVALMATLAISRIAQRHLLEDVLPRTRMSLSARYSVASAVSYIGFIVAFGLAIAVLGIDLTNLAIILGALSVGVGFGLQTIVNNFISGLILLVERPVKVGDWVIVAGLEGLVKRINIRSTEIETWQRAAVIVPNAEILSNPITNLTFRDSYGRIEVDVGVAYGSDVTRVRDILLDCAKSTEKLTAYPAPWVVFKNFGESSLDFRLHAYTDNVMNRTSIASEVRFLIERRFREEGIHIPFPQRVIHYAERKTAADAPPAPPDTAGRTTPPNVRREGF